MIDLIMKATIFVMGDMYFWPAMTFTTLVGIFIGAVIHDGDMKQVTRTLISIVSYAILITTVNLTRIIPQLNLLNKQIPIAYNQAFASPVTIVVVTLFYLLGVFLGVCLVKRAHKK